MNKEFQYENYKVPLNKMKFKLFKTKGTKCVKCGLEASYFALEYQISDPKQTPHLNLYGVDEYGKHHLMTKDHIIPQSIKKIDKLRNFQLMCESCNGDKGGHIDKNINSSKQIKRIKDNRKKHKKK